MKEIINRLKSPVVIIQLISIIGTIVVLLVPNMNETVEKIVASITAIINVLAGLNNPADKNNW